MVLIPRFRYTSSEDSPEDERRCRDSGIPLGSYMCVYIKDIYIYTVGGCMYVTMYISKYLFMKT